MFEKVAKNSLFLSVSQILSRGIGFVFFIYLARNLTTGEFGIYNFILGIVYNFIPIADFGVERLVLRDISRDQEKTAYYLNRLLPLRIFLALIAYVLILIFGIVLGQPLRQIGYLAIFGLALLPYNLTFLFSSFFNAEEKMKYTAEANIALILLTVFFGVIFTYLKLGLGVIFLSFPLANLILALVFLLNAQKLGLLLGWVIDWGFVKKVLKESWVFAALTIIAVFYLRISMISLNLLKGSVETGLYGTAFKYIEGLLLIPQSLTLALFPVFSRLSSDDNNKKLGFLYLKGILILFLISLPFAVMFSVFSKQIIVIPYGERYFQASFTLPIFAIAIILFFLNSLAGNIIQNSERVKGYLPIFLANFLVEIILCILLIPKFGIIGAVWSVVGGELFALVANNLFVAKILRAQKLPA